MPYLSFIPAKLEYVTSDFYPGDIGAPGFSTFYRYGYTFGVRDNQSTSVFVALDSGGSTYASTPMVECVLYNASYRVGFNFTYPRQDINIIQRTLRDPVLIPYISQNATYGTPMWAYMNLMDAYANILLGYTQVSRGSTSYKTMYQITALNNLNRTNDFGPDQLGLTLENMFQNMTLNVLSDTSFQ